MSYESNMNKFAEYSAACEASSPALDKIKALFDDGKFTSLCAASDSGIVAGCGYISNALVYAYAQNKDILGGAVTKQNAKIIKKIYDMAAKTGCPIVSILDSNGVLLSDGMEVLEAYSEILMMSNNISGVVPQIALITGTCAGTSAMLACSADFVVMSKDAELFLNAPFNTSDDENAKDAGTADFAAKAGIASIVAENENEAINEVKKLIGLLPANNLSASNMFEGETNMSASISIPQDITSLDLSDVANVICDKDSIVSINESYAENAKTLLATIGGVAAGVVCAGGELGSKDAKKISRFVRTCDAFNIPIVTLINTLGFENTAYPCLIKESAKLAHAYAEATTAKISVICANAIGSAYIALASKNAACDITIAWPTAVISPLKPQTAAEFLMHDKLKGTENLQKSREALADEYISSSADAFIAAQNGMVDAVVAPENTRSYIVDSLEILMSKRQSRLPKKHSNNSF